MLIAVVEELYRPEVPEALYLDLEGIDPLGVHFAGIRQLENVPFVSQIFVRTDFIFLISPVIVEHTELYGYDGAVSLMLADHVYVFVRFRTHHAKHLPR